jgi:hypothetical protein
VPVANEAGGALARIVAVARPDPDKEMPRLARFMRGILIDFVTDSPRAIATAPTSALGFLCNSLALRRSLLPEAKEHRP